MKTLPVIAVNGVLGAQVSPLDRGFAYGDGVFETCKMLHGKIPLWHLHKERLLKSCEKLLIPVAIDLVEAQFASLIALLATTDVTNAVVKFTVQFPTPLSVKDVALKDAPIAGVPDPLN